MNAAIEELMVVPVINPAASTSAATAITGATVDRAGFKGVTFAVQIGAAGSGITAGTVTLNESAAANMSGSVASTQFAGGGLAAADFTTAGNANSVVELGYTGNAQYLQLVVTPTNNSGALYVSAVCILSDPVNAPTPNPPVMPTTGPNTSTPA